MVVGRYISVAACLIAASFAQGQQNVVILLDDSGSMGQSMTTNNRLVRMRAAKDALQSVLQQLPDDANVGLRLLNGRGGKWPIPFGPIDKQALAASIETIKPRGGTPLGEAMKGAADKLLEAREQYHYGTYQLLILTDGEANKPAVVDRYLPEIKARGIAIDVIGVDMAQQHSLATRTNSYRKADDPESLRQAISEVLAETDSSDGDTGESDFELLAGLDDEVALAMLEALQSPGNHPIGERPHNQRPSGEPSGEPPERASATGTSHDGGHSDTPAGGTSSRKVVTAVGGACCLMPLLLGGFIVVALVVIRSKPNRR